MEITGDALVESLERQRVLALVEDLAPEEDVECLPEGDLPVRLFLPTLLHLPCQLLPMLPPLSCCPA
jgi:hypothetical protein